MSLNSVELERELSMDQPARVTPLRYGNVPQSLWFKFLTY